MTKRVLLGRVFISHSSLDQTFVRRLERRLARGGFETWLDEHEMVVGDPLAAKIAEGVSKASVVLVVVSENSVKSRWLKYELNIATERMVKGECRVIPIVIDDADLPAEVRALLYSDFRDSFSTGFKSILTALAYEEGRAAATAAFWSQAWHLVSKVFGGIGSSFTFGGYGRDQYNIVSVAAESGDVDVIYDHMSAYGEAEPLDDSWLSEYQEAMEKSDARLYLMVTECPISFETIRAYHDVGSVTFRHFHGFGYAVFVDLSSTKDVDKRFDLIKRARMLLHELALKE